MVRMCVGTEERAARERPRGIRSAAALAQGLLAVGWLAAVGCGPSDPDAGAPAKASSAEAPSVPALPPDPVDLTRLKAAFAQASPAFQVYVDEAVAVLRTRAYADALEQFQKLDRNPKLTPEQRQAVQEVLMKLQPLAAGQRR